MDNKYGLGSTKVATVHHTTHHKAPVLHPQLCKFCGSSEIVLSSTLHDHRCMQCGELQHDVPQGYSTGRSSDY